MKKSITAILMTTLFLIAMIAPLSINTAQAADSASWYTSVNGVLSTDSYSLYPYTAQSLNVGFSKFGELIGLPAGMDPATATQADYLGLEYGTRDPFCPPTVIPMTSWINGWYMDLQYTDPALTLLQRDRHLWAFAMFGDGFGFGGDWIYAATPGSNPGYGRQTNGQCVTDPLQVLYDGPREYIVVSRTHIFDKQGVTTWPVVDLAITMKFDKVTKQVTLFKDVKLTIPKMHLWGRLDVQLSNREEFDLGAAPGYSSYAHFYEDGGITPYDNTWHLAKNLTRDDIQYFAGDGTTKDFTITPPTGFMANDFVKVWKDGVFVDPSAYTINYVSGVLHFTVAPATGTSIKVVYKYVFQTNWNTYDIAQVISADTTLGIGNYVAWTATWPPVSDYTVDGILRYLDPLVGVAEADCISEPKQSPLIIAEWDFLMDHTDIPQFRAVEVKGLTNNHDGKDMALNGANVIDKEVQWQLAMHFSPWDLRDSVEKQEYSWVDIRSAYTATSLTLTNGVNDPIYYACLPNEKTNLGFTTNGWTGYFVKDSESANDYKPESVWVNTLVNGAVTHSKNWALKLDGTTGYEMLKVTPIAGVRTATSPLTLKFEDLVDFGFWYNMTAGTVGPHIEIKLYSAADGTGAWVNLFAEQTNPIATIGTWNHYTLNTIGDFIGSTADTAFTDGVNGFHSYEFFTNLYEGYYVGSVGVQVQNGNVAIIDDLSVGYLNSEGVRYERVYNMEEDKLIPSTWDSYCVFAERVLVNGVLKARGTDYSITFGGVNTIKPSISGLASGSKNIKVLYNTIEENDKGRYEWVTVGRDANSVDSAGSAIVAESFDSIKHIAIGIAGTDMYGVTYDVQIPDVMSKIAWASGSFPAAVGTKEDYKDIPGTGNTVGYRAHLADDWCTYWPVTSSNIITVGGPMANMLAYYDNDFTDAFYGIPQFATGSPYSGYITGIPCWNRGWDGTWNVYGRSTATSYAVISTTKDINGTVIFVVYGLDGRDTFYACQWLKGDSMRGLSPGIVELQDAPCGATSIILKISYADAKHPTYSIPEVLGTISETLWNCTALPWHTDVTDLLKGNIHDP